MRSVLLAFGLAAALADPTPVEQRMAGAAALASAGKSAEALKAYREVLTSMPPSDARRGAVLEQVASIETDSGAYAEALRDANAAAAVHARHGNVRGRGSALNRAGLASLYAGDYEAAATSFRAAIALSKSVHDDPGRAEQLSNLANTDFFTGRYADAAAGYAEALALADAHRAEAWSARRRRILLVNQATLNQRLGRDEEALALYREVQAGSDLRPREQAQILTNLGVVYRRLGDPVKALAAYDEARALYAREQFVDGELGVMKNRGIALALDLNQLEAARQNFSDALAAATKAANRREMLQAQLYRGETELRLGHLEPAREDFGASLDLARALRTPEEEWKALYGLARVELRSNDAPHASAHLEQALAVIENIREAIRVPTLRSDFFNDKREVYDALISIEIGRATPERLFDLIERSHSRGWRDRLGLTSAIALRSVQQKLPRDAVLLDYWSSPLGSAVVTITHDRAVVTRVEVDEAAIRSMVESLGAGEAHTAALPATILPPLPTGVRHVIIVPDGALTVVPFEILPAGDALLIEKAAVSYVPTGALLFRPHKQVRRMRAPWTRQLRAFADPLLRSATLDDAGAVRARLAGSAEEARAIARELGGRTELHVGADDRKSYLRDAGNPAPILHIASHAVADANAMERSRILFSPATSSGATADYLFLKEAYDLPLKNVELAVLSACDTERGRLLRGEGVQSFSRAFLAAGAQTTVTTLWRVADEPTASFMKVFYHQLQRGVPRDEALRQAKLRFMRSSAVKDPHYWAAFVLTGDGLRPVPHAMQWSTVLLFGAVLALIAISAIALRNRNLGRSAGAPS